MEAVISGQAGVALLVDGDTLSSIHVHDPETVVTRRAGEFHYLFGAASDLVFVEDVSTDDVRQGLQAAADGEDVTQLTLLLLASDRSDEVRQLAAEELSELLTANSQAAAFAERLLLSTALPQDADLSGALKFCSAGRARDFLIRLTGLQPFVQLSQEAWQAIPEDFFGESAEDCRAAADAAFVREGVFRQFVLAAAGESDMQTALLSALQIPAIRSLASCRDIVKQWNNNVSFNQTTESTLKVFEVPESTKWEGGVDRRRKTDRRSQLYRAKAFRQSLLLLKIAAAVLLTLIILGYIYRSIPLPDFDTLTPTTVRIEILKSALAMRRAVQDVRSSGSVATVEVIQHDGKLVVHDIDINATEAGLQALRESEMRIRVLLLIKLDLGNTSVDDTELARLAEVLELECLSVHGCEQLTDDAFLALRHLRNLKTVDLRGTRLSGKGLRRLPDAPIEELMLDGFHHTLDGDAVVEVAERFKDTLRRLTAQGIPLSPEQQERLRPLMESERPDGFGHSPPSTGRE